MSGAHCLSGACWEEAGSPPPHPVQVLVWQRGDCSLQRCSSLPVHSQGQIWSLTGLPCQTILQQSDVMWPLDSSQMGMLGLSWYLRAAVHPLGTPHQRRWDPTECHHHGW